MDLRRSGRLQHERAKTRATDSRTPFQRDRDRLLYCSALRRLSEITQVVSPGSEYVLHNRLTHSLQVSQVGRRLAERLLRDDVFRDAAIVDPDVVEAACLAHDLGHPPFGHLAEKELNKYAKDFGGFEGNAQTFRILTRLSFRETAYPGLNLTRASLAATLKYPWKQNQNPSKLDKWGAYESESREFSFANELCPPAAFARTIEAELMDWADDIAYSVARRGRLLSSSSHSSSSFCCSG